ncbi:MAG TPA: TonB-dependent receptor [Puia sp.]|nr:TonB-dependent receptor [Puia sp.]
MKKNLAIGGDCFHTVKKALLVMKLTFVLLMAGILQVSAKVNGQAKVSLKLNQVEIAKALKSIENQGDYRFLYNNNLKSLKQKISIDVSSTGIKDVLDKMFVGTDLAYKVLDNNLIVVISSMLTLQDIKVTGKVTGESGEPLSGVSINLKGTSIGTTTDNNGNFTLTVPETGTLVISYIGYQTTEVKVNSQSVINISLSQSKKTMDEVVVIGYGQTSKRDLTGSIVKIAGKEISDKPNTNPVASLQSKVAGLYVVNNGTPGQAPDIRIRGTGSIGNIAPLYVVDGIFATSIDYLNPNDIESIEVLKDPSSLAIFGVRGANGVILVTTKRAKAGESTINFNTTFGTKQLVDKISLANASQFNKLYLEEVANQADIGGNGIPVDYSKLNSNTDWINAVTRKGIYNTNNLSIAGSTDNNKFNIGFGYTLDQGIILKEQLQKITANFSDEYKVNKWLKIGGNLVVTRENLPYDATQILNNARKVMPQISDGTKTFKVADLYGSDSIMQNLYSTVLPALQNSGVQNPLFNVDNSRGNIDIQYRYVGSAFMEFNLAKGLTFRSTAYGDITNEDHTQYTPLYYGYQPASSATGANSVDQIVQLNNNTTLKVISNTLRNFQTDNILSYRKSFGDHNLNATAGFTTTYHEKNYKQVWLDQSSTTTPIPNDSRFWYISVGPYSGKVSQDPNKSFSDQAENTTVSFLGRVMYNYAQKYFLTGSIRNDATSQLASANRNQVFWTVGAAWDLTKENFMNNQKLFNYLKLKGSLGVLGNQSIPGGYDYPIYPYAVSNAQAVFGSNILLAYGPQWLASPDLKWEVVNAQEVGVELNAFQNNLHFEATYFNRQTNNLMIVVPVPGTNQSKITNGGGIDNWGEEFSASWHQRISKDFGISLGGNITFLQNKVTSLSPELGGSYIDATSENNGQQDSRTQIGHPIGSFYGYKVTGVFQSYAQILASPVETSLGTVRPGDFIYADLNHDGKIDANDRTFIGNPSPKFTYGANVNLDYKNFNLSVDVGGVWGNQIQRVWGSLESPYQFTNFAGFEVGAWNGPGTSNWQPRASLGDRINYVGSTYTIENGSYFRIRNLQLGYNLPADVYKHLKLKAARIFVNVQNLKTWKNNSGYTPEYGGFINQPVTLSSNAVTSYNTSLPPSAIQFGVDQGGGAIPRITTVGLNITF